MSDFSKVVCSTVLAVCSDGAEEVLISFNNDWTERLESVPASEQRISAVNLWALITTITNVGDLAANWLEDGTHVC